MHQRAAVHVINRLLDVFIDVPATEPKAAPEVSSDNHRKPRVGGLADSWKISLLLSNPLKTGGLSSSLLNVNVRSTRSLTWTLLTMHT